MPQQDPLQVLRQIRQRQPEPTPTPTPADPLEALDRIRNRIPSAEQMLYEDTAALGSRIGQAVMSVPGAQTVMSAAAPVFKFLGASGHGSATWFDSAITDAKRVFDDPSLLLSKDFYARRRAETIRAIKETGQAFGEPLGLSQGPPVRMNFHDVIKNQAPDFKAEHPAAAGALGFLGDILLDPLTYLSLGTAKGVTMGGRALTREGEKALATTAKALRRGELPKVPAGVDVTDLLASTPLQPGVIRETSEKIVQRVAEAGPELDKALFAVPGFRVRISPIFSRAGFDVPGTRAVGQAVKTAAAKLTSRPTAEALRLGPLWDKVESLKSSFKLPPEFVERRNFLLDQRNAITEDLVDATRAITKDLTAEERQSVSNLMARIESGRSEWEAATGRAMGADEGNELLRRAFAGQKLSPAQMSVIARLQQGYKDAAELEDLSGVVGESMKAYDPRLHDVVGDPAKMTKLLNEGPNLTAEDFKLFDQMDEARLTHGDEPEMQAFTLYAQRLAEARKRAANDQFNKSVEAIFGTSDISKLPPAVRRDIRFFGEGQYPLTDAVKALPIVGRLFKMFDRGQSLWKRGATSANPAFGPKNFVSDTLQGASVIGARAFRGFDPRSFIDAAIATLEYSPKLIGRERASLQLPEFVNNFIQKNFGTGQSGVDSVLASRVAFRNLLGPERLRDYASRYRMVSAIGEDIPGDQLVKELKDHGIAQGFDASGQQLRRTLERGVMGNTDSFPRVAAEIAKFWNWPSYLQDLTRSALYINARRIGYAPLEAAGKVNEALFDYTKGLGPFQQEVLKRIIPFYSFQRFSIPFVLRQALQRPGQVAAVNKFTTLLEKLLSTGEEPTEAEREIFGNTYLVERPRVFRGFDKDGKAAFNVISNFTPLDAIGMFTTSPDGSIDYRRTTEKLTLASMTPFLKMPLETLVKRDFFTDQALERAGRLGQINQSTLARSIPDPVKELMSWEVRADRQGREQVYINPYLAHWSLGAFPFLRNYLRGMQPGQTPLERAMQIVGASDTKRLDLREEQQRQETRDEGRLNELRYAFRQAQGAADVESKLGQDRLKKAEDDMEMFLNAIDAKRARLQQLGEVRGAGAVEQPPQ